MKIKGCVITASRSEYGLLRWIMTAIRDDPEFELLTLVTGAHLSPEYGSTFREIENDGFRIDAKVEILLASDSAAGIAKSMGLCALGIADALDRLNPDFVLVLGDRYELLPICSTALVMRIPIVHVSGGDVTEGAIDDEIRNAVSQLSSLHFPGTEEAARRLLSMGVSRDDIVVAGEPGLDNFRKLPLLSRPEIARVLGLRESDAWILLTYHPETKKSPEENLSTVHSLAQALLTETDAEIVATYANADEGGRAINVYLEEIAGREGGRFKVFKSLGQQKYLSLMKSSALVAGNSSSGIVEAPMLGIPVLNVGDRQRGRHLCGNVIGCASEGGAIVETIRSLAGRGFPPSKPDMYYGDGASAERIAAALKHRFAGG